MYSAKIIQISEPDQSGRFEVKFDVYKDHVLTFESQSRSGIEKNIVVDDIRNYLLELKKIDEEANKFRVGEVITI